MTTYLVLGTLLVAIVYFALTLTGVALLLSPLVGWLAFGFLRLIDPAERGTTGQLRTLGITAVGTTVAVALAMTLGMTTTAVWDWLGVLVGLIVAAGTYVLAGRSASIPCALCKRPIRGRANECPRCGDSLCSRPTCWSAKLARCARCLQNEVVIFPLAERWWDARLGPRVMKGECSSCYKEAHEANLRECGQCHWPMCQRCWDYYNGVCQRCEWVIPDLPAKLAPFVSDSRRVRKGGRSARKPMRTAPEAPAGSAPRAGSNDDTIVQPGPGRPRRR